MKSNLFDRLSIIGIIIAFIVLISTIFVIYTGVQIQKTKPLSIVLNSSNATIKSSASSTIIIPSATTNLYSLINSATINNCGDFFPSKLEANKSIIFYPIYVDYSEGNLLKIQRLFCRDAFLVQKGTEKVIQVASFTDLKKADKLKKLLEDILGNTELGKPREILLKPEDSP
jgi:serine/threonine-protein kinase